MRNLVLAMCMAATCSTVVPAAETVRPARSVRFERIDILTTKDFWNLTRTQSIHAKSGAAIGYWQFDSEDAPRQDGWIAVGIVVGGLGDIGEIPIAARVWTSGGVDLLPDVSNAISINADDAIAVFGKNREECTKTPLECAKSLPQFRISPSGKVVAGGESLGVVK